MPDDTKNPAAPASIERELLTPDDVEKMYGLKTNTQATLRHRKLIPHVKLGPRTPRYRKADLDMWVASRVVPAMSKGGGEK
ncbi:MAG: helix-turn-helix domain-containing protein [Kofleriaceae bacterium]|nr:helix-turn-helix domain-containing protein [Kofleriaceae bacterium]